MLRSIVLLVLVFVLSVAGPAKASQLPIADTSVARDSATVVDSVRSSGITKLALGGSQLLLSYGAFTGSVLYLASETQIDTATSANMGIVFIGMISTLTSSLVTQMFGEYVMDGEGSYLATWGGSMIGLLLTNGWQNEPSITAKVMHLTIPPVLGGFVAYWISSGVNRSSQFFPRYDVQLNRYTLRITTAF